MICFFEDFKFLGGFYEEITVCDCGYLDGIHNAVGGGEQGCHYYHYLRPELSA
jgi:hypothetical protein